MNLYFFILKKLTYGDGIVGNGAKISGWGDKNVLTGSAIITKIKIA